MTVNCNEQKIEKLVVACLLNLQCELPTCIKNINICTYIYSKIQSL